MRSVLCIVLTLAAIPAANAACPAAFSADCEPPAGAEVCTFDSANNTWTCDLGLNGNNAAEAWVVWDFDDNEYAAYGTDGGGNTFCCTQACPPSSGGHFIDLLGTTAGDKLAFTDGSNWAPDPRQLDACGPDPLQATIRANTGDDRLLGSNSTDPNYQEILEGDPGFDVIEGLDGDDILNGGDDEDTLYGGDGDDALYGGLGKDALNGEGGGDTVDGQSGRDVVCGGGYTSTPDILRGGPGDDEICGITNGQEAKLGGLGTNECFDTSQGTVSGCNGAALNAPYCASVCP